MKSILLIGAGRFGKNIAVQLQKMGHEVMLVDKCEGKINECLPYVTNALIGETTNELFLKTLGVRNFDVCIVTIGNDFQSSVETTALLKELGAKKVISRAERDLQEKILLRNGADEVIYPEKQVAMWTAIRYGSNYILDYTELDSEHAIYEVEVPNNWLGKTIGEIDVRKKYHINIVAIKIGDKLNAMITPNIELTKDMSLFIIGENKSVHKIF